ncbi:MAG: LamG domain-containing protein, partial [bacterium]
VAPLCGQDEAVLRWTFDKREITAGNVADLSGNGNSGLATDPGIGWGAGRTGDQDKNDQAAEFGKAQTEAGIFTRPVVFCKDDPSLRLKNALTLECWIKLKDRPFRNGNRFSVIMAKADVNIWDWAPIAKTLSYGLVYLDSTADKDNLTFMLNDGQTTHVLVANTADLVRPGEWHHLAATYDGKQMRLFVDARLTAASAPLTFTVKETGSDFWIGLFSNALIDEVQITGKAKSF